MFEKHRKFLTPDLTSGSDLGCWEPEPMGKSLLKNFLPHLCMFKMISVLWGPF